MSIRVHERFHLKKQSQFAGPRSKKQSQLEPQAGNLKKQSQCVPLQASMTPEGDKTRLKS